MSGPTDTGPNRAGVRKRQRSRPVRWSRAKTAPDASFWAAVARVADTPAGDIDRVGVDRRRRDRGEPERSEPERLSGRGGDGQHPGDGRLHGRKEDVSAQRRRIGNLGPGDGGGGLPADGAGCGVDRLQQRDPLAKGEPAEEDESAGDHGLRVGMPAGGRPPQLGRLFGGRRTELDAGAGDVGPAHRHGRSGSADRHSGTGRNGVAQQRPRRGAWISLGHAGRADRSLRRREDGRCARRPSSLCSTMTISDSGGAAPVPEGSTATRAAMRPSRRRSTCDTDRIATRSPAGPPRKGDRSPSRRRIPSAVKSPSTPGMSPEARHNCHVATRSPIVARSAGRHRVASWVDGVRVFRSRLAQDGNQIRRARLPHRAVRASRGGVGDAFGALVGVACRAAVPIAEPDVARSVMTVIKSHVRMEPTSSVGR